MLATEPHEANGWYRDVAMAAVAEHLTEHRTNTIASDHVRRAVEVALDAFEDEIMRQAETREAYAVMLGSQPMLIVPTRRIAKQQLKLMRRSVGEGAWRITRTQHADFPDTIGSVI